MKNVGFSQFSSILLMLPYKIYTNEHAPQFSWPNGIFVVSQGLRIKSYTGIKNRSGRKFPCRVQSKFTFFAIWFWKLAYYRENQPALVVEYIKNLIQKFWTTFLLQKWKCQCFDRIAREPSNMVKAREQSKTLNYTDPFKIDQITLHEILLSLQSFIWR